MLENCLNMHHQLNTKVFMYRILKLIWANIMVYYQIYSIVYFCKYIEITSQVHSN